MSAQTARAAQAQRWAAYCVLRDAGTRPAGAAQQVGIGETAGKRYEHAYRQARGLPRAPGRGRWP